MFDYIPEFFKAETADTDEEADGWYDDKKNNRRPPELLPRDEVARAINSEIKAGRGSPHGGVFLDIASRRDAEFIRRRLPSMYHQFKELADVDITAEPMEVGPTCHYVMGGVEVDADTEESIVTGLYAAGEVAGGMHGSNRLGGNSLSDLLVFGRRAGRNAAYAAAPAAGPGRQVDADDVRAARGPRAARRRSRSGRAARTRTRSRRTSRTSCSDLVGIIRTAEELSESLEEIEQLKERAKHARRRGAPAVQPRLAPRDRPAQHAAGLGVHREGRAGAQGVPRRPHPRRLPRARPRPGDA